MQRCGRCCQVLEGRKYTTCVVAFDLACMLPGPILSSRLKLHDSAIETYPSHDDDDDDDDDDDSNRSSVLLGCES